MFLSPSVTLSRINKRKKSFKKQDLKITNHEGNANQSYSERLPHSHQDSIILSYYHDSIIPPYYQKPEKQQVLAECEELGTLCTIDRNVKWYLWYGKQYSISSKIKNSIIIWFINSTSRFTSIPKIIESPVLKRYLYIHVHSGISYSSVH